MNAIEAKIRSECRERYRATGDLHNPYPAFTIMNIAWDKEADKIRDEEVRSSLGGER